jgi:hypothetical protein
MGPMMNRDEAFYWSATCRDRYYVFVVLIPFYKVVQRFKIPEQDHLLVHKLTKSPWIHPIYVQLAKVWIGSARNAHNVPDMKRTCYVY